MLKLGLQSLAEPIHYALDNEIISAKGPVNPFVRRKLGFGSRVCCCQSQDRESCQEEGFWHLFKVY